MHRKLISRLVILALVAFSSIFTLGALNPAAGLAPPPPPHRGNCGYAVQTVKFEQATTGPFQVTCMDADVRKPWSVAVRSAAPPKPWGNEPPECEDLSQIVNFGEAKTVQLSCTDTDGQVSRYAIEDQTTNGMLSDLDPVTGTVTYTPNTGFSGADSFTFKAADDDGAESNTASATLTVSGQPPPSSGDTGDKGNSGTAGGTPVGETGVTGNSSQALSGPECKPSVRLLSSRKSLRRLLIKGWAKVKLDSKCKSRAKLAIRASVAGYKKVIKLKPLLLPEGRVTVTLKLRKEPNRGVARRARGINLIIIRN